ncbi:MAG: hypothetical protein CMI02_05630 [Oceanospirillaceae bacterium]|jgi:hypothetical protein|uniref:hypothetical protein n=1 Tax=Alloalcanivorax profundimaris TaxID=2735259 RepID=UPI000C61E471|nr:hypothetical protein [Alloalcanivorax profundimaris]MBT11499.1 hypothetical protein [Oceanospirillaceae bacterium]
MKVAVIVFFLGAFLGGVCTYYYPEIDTNVTPFDRNGDGAADTQYIYRSDGSLKLLKMDRNYDGDIDDETEFDTSNLPVKEFSDDNFDGEFDTRTIYEFGIIKETLSDLDKDGEEDLRVFYNYGVMKKFEVLAEGEWKVVWIEK